MKVCQDLVVQLPVLISSSSGAAARRTEELDTMSLFIHWAHILVMLRYRPPIRVRQNVCRLLHDNAEPISF